MKEKIASNTKPITKQKENRGWFNVCFMVFLLITNGLRCVRSEDIGNALIPGNTAMNSILANKHLRGFEPSGRRGLRCVRSEDIGNAIIPGNIAMNSLLANKHLRGFEPSGRRLVGFNYGNFPHGNSQTSNPPVKQANPYQRPCNAAEYCRQGNKGKN